MEGTPAWAGVVGLESVCLQGQQGKKAGSLCMAEDFSLPGSEYGLSPTCRYPDPTAPEPLTHSASSSNRVTTLPSSLHSLFLKPIPSRLGKLDKSHGLCRHTQHMAAASGDRARCVSCFLGKCWSHGLLPLQGDCRCSIPSHSLLS